MPPTSHIAVPTESRLYGTAGLRPGSGHAIPVARAKAPTGEPMTTAISVPTLRRLPLYLRLLDKWQSEGRTTVSCTHFADALGFDPTQVRKDLAVCGVPGRPKVGYNLRELAVGVARFLGWDNPGEAFLIGAGPLGAALMAYEGFAERGLAIVAAFDPDPAIAGNLIAGKPVLPMSKLPELARRMHISLGVLALPSAQANEGLRACVDAGIEAVWSFAAVRPEAAEGIIIEHVDLAQSLAVLSHRLATLGKKRPPRTT